MSTDPRQLSELIRRRRSIKPPQYERDREIPRHVIDEILESARWAPSHGLTEPWMFKVFHGDGRQRLADFFSSSYEERTPAKEFNEKRAAMLGSVPLMAPCTIAICMHRQEEERIPEIEEIAAVSCAVQNMHLTATAHELGAFWSSGENTYQAATPGFLGLKEGERCLGFFFIGYPAGEWPDEVRRSPIEEKVEWIT